MLCLSSWEPLLLRFGSHEIRIMDFLMTFGGGALLAALTIDLVGSALKKGHFQVLAIGCIFGIFFL